MNKPRVKGVLVKQRKVKKFESLNRDRRRMVCPNFVICPDFTALRMLFFSEAVIYEWPSLFLPYNSTNK